MMHAPQIPPPPAVRPSTPFCKGGDVRSRPVHVGPQTQTQTQTQVQVQVQVQVQARMCTKGSASTHTSAQQARFSTFPPLQKGGRGDLLSSGAYA